MRLSQTPPSLLSLLLAVLCHIGPVSAGPYPKDDLHDVGLGYLQERGCDSYCGSENQYCCSAGEGCYTSYSNAVAIAYCEATSAAGWEYFTTTYTSTDLVIYTSTYSSYWSVAATTTTAVAEETCVPTVEGETSCGSICCSSSQVCEYLGQCVESGTTTTESYSAYIRPTSGGVTTVTTTGKVTATTTEPFVSAVSATATTTGITIAETTSKGLSGGAIAGIVIGTLAAIVLALLFCFCCVLKAGIDGILAIFGLGPRRSRRRTERIETVERYSRHGSGTASRRETHSGWFAGSGRPATVIEKRKKSSSGLGGLGAVGAGLVGLAVILGLKRKHDKKEVIREDISSTYYTDSYTGTSASSESSDRRTRESRRDSRRDSRRH